jgi:hypothetical protein
MTIEITVTYAKSKKVDVPAELAPDKDWNYPDPEAFDAWVANQADVLAAEPGPPDWVSTEALDERYNEVYSL